jgi:hypothetical protein
MGYGSFSLKPSGWIASPHFRASPVCLFIIGGIAVGAFDQHQLIDAERSTPTPHPPPWAFKPAALSKIAKRTQLPTAWIADRS